MNSGEGSVLWRFLLAKVFDDLANDAADIQGEDRHALAVAQGPEDVLVIEEYFEHGCSPKSRRLDCGHTCFGRTEMRSARSFP